MINIYKSNEINSNSFQSIESIEEGCWINIIAPSEQELILISKKTSVPLDFLNAALDEEETSRIEFSADSNVAMFIVDIPFTEVEENSLTYDTYPLSIIHTNKEIITVCLKNSKVFSDFIDGKIRSFFTYKRPRFILQILYRISTYYLFYLRQIDKKSYVIEKKLHKSMNNTELIQLLSLEKSLVYFSTSLKANEITLEKMQKTDIMQKYPEDHDVLEDVIIENKQAIEMAAIYSNILSGTMDAFASIISNNLHIFIKYIASIAIVILIPLTIFCMFSMKLQTMPFATNPYGFWIIIAIACTLSMILGIIISHLQKK